MPSSGIPTPFSGLNQWELSDKPRMEDFNEDNRKIDTALGQLSAGKVEQEDFDRFAAQTSAAIAEKADVKNMIFSATATYVDGYFELNGLPDDLPDPFTVRFSAPTGYLPGDKLRIGANELDIVTLAMTQPSFGAFASGALVSMDVGISEQKAFLAAGNGRISEGKRFDVYDLPPSRLTSEPSEWEFESYPGGDLLEIMGVQTVGDETYLFAANTIYVYNHLDQRISRYSHDIATSNRNTNIAYTIGRFVCYEAGWQAGTHSVAINIDTKRISQIPATNRPTCVIPGKDGSVYAFGGLANQVATFSTNEFGGQIYTARRGSDVNSAWDVSSVATMASQSGTGWSVAPNSAAAYSDGTDIWFAVYTTTTGTHPNDHSRYRYHIPNNTIHRTDGIPAFCTATSHAIPYGFEYDGKYYGIHGRRVSAYTFKTNTVDPAVVIPDVPVDRPNLVTVYKNTWMVFTAKGIFRLVFMPADALGDNIGGVLEIYAGQQYRAERIIPVRDKITITREWQLATEDIEIKVGEYSGHGKVYIRSV